MQNSEYKNYFEKEDRHFYYVALHELIADLARTYLHTRNAAILDAGTGTGGLAAKLQAFGRVSAIDPHPLAVKYSKMRKVQIKQARVEKMPFPKNKFDLVTCIDILVVVKNDLKALAELWRVTKPGGILILRVSAHEWLRTGHEQVVLMNRRYEMAEITRKMKMSGWKIEKKSYMHTTLLIPLWIKSLVGSKLAVSNIRDTGEITNRVMLAIIRMENWWLKRFGLPNGIGILIVARKPQR